MRRLSRAGFKKPFVRTAILPDWWDESCEDDAALLPETEVRVARFFGLPVSTIRETAGALAAPVYDGAQLRHVRGADRERLAPAIHSALQIASAVVRNLDATFPAPAVPPVDALEWRGLISDSGKAIKLEDIVTDLWHRGIPVVPLEVLPSPGFQGLACIIAGRPVVLLGGKHDEPGRVAFVIAHEIGHIAAGDCAPDRPVVDQEEEIADDTDIEHGADRFATRLLIGGDTVPLIEADGWRDLANKGADVERARGTDAGAVIFAWARRTGDYSTATMAVQALYRFRGARRLLRDHFDRHVRVEAASESDRGLFRCLFGDHDSDAPAA